MRSLLLMAVVAACISTTSYAQSSDTAKAANKAKKPTIDDLYVDFAMPDLPALGLLGVNPSKVTRPGNLKELSLAVLPLSTGSRTIGTGVAVGWAPVYSFARSVDAYRTSFARRIAFSLATVKASSGSEVDAAVGARVILLDRSDPLMNEDYGNSVEGILEAASARFAARDEFWNRKATLGLLKTIVQAMTDNPVGQAALMNDLLESWNLLTPPKAATVDEQISRFQRATSVSAKKEKARKPYDLESHPDVAASARALAEEYLKAVRNVPDTPAEAKAKLAELRKKFLEDQWNATVIAVDLGGLFQSSSGKWGGLKGNRVAGSAAAAIRTGRLGQVVALIEGREGVGASPKERWYYSAGARLLLGNATRRFSVEGVLSRARDVDSEKNGTTKRFTVGTEFRVAEGFWVEIAFGGERTPASTQAAQGTAIISLAGLKYAFKVSPRFTQIPGAVGDEK